MRCSSTIRRSRAVLCLSRQTPVHLGRLTPRVSSLDKVLRYHHATVTLNMTSSLNFTQTSLLSPHAPQLHPKQTQRLIGIYRNYYLTNLPPFLFSTPQTKTPTSPPSNLQPLNLSHTTIPPITLRPPPPIPPRPLLRRPSINPIPPQPARRQTPKGFAKVLDCLAWEIGVC